MLAQFVAYGTGPAPAMITYVSTAEQAEAASGSSFTFTAQDIGVAAANRYVLVGVLTADGTAAGATITGCTIGGNAATSHGQNGGTLVRAALFGLLVAAGTTADIVVTMSASIGGSATVVPCTIGVWNANGLLSTTPGATATDYDTTGDLALGLASSADGIAVAVAGHWNGAAAAWSGYDSTKDFTQSGSGAPTDASGISGVTTGAALTITYGGVGTQGAGVSATFR